MSEQNYIIQGKSVKDIADAVRSKRNVQLSPVGTMTPAEIAAEVYKIRLGCPINVTMHGSGVWERPSEWPNLDLLERHDNELFMTIDNSGRIDDPFLSVAVTTTDSSAVTYQIGSIANGAFVATETDTVASGGTYTRIFAAGDGVYPVVRIAATANITNFDFKAATVDNHSYVARYNAIVERVGRIYSFRGVWGTYWLERDSTLVSYLTTLETTWSSCYSLQSLDLSGWDTSGWAVTSMASTWYNCYSLQSLDLSGWDTSGFTAADWNRTFYLTRSLKSLDLSMFDLSKITQWGSSSYNLAMANFMVNFTAGATNRGKFNPTAYKTLNLSMCNLMSRQSLLNVIDMLASGVSGYTLKIGSVNLGKLTAAEKALATAKGWSIIA